MNITGGEMQIFKVTLLCLCLALAFFYFSQPGKLVVNNRGEIQGSVNNIRETIQGKKFWVEQLNAMDVEFQEIKRQTETGPDQAPQRIQKLQELMDLLPIVNDRFKDAR